MIKRYEKPELKVHGSLKEITMEGLQKGMDGGDVPYSSMSL